MHERWLEERHHEHYYKLAKKLDYRSRASFKLMQIDELQGILQAHADRRPLQHPPRGG